MVAWNFELFAGRHDLNRWILKESHQKNQSSHPQVVTSLYSDKVASSENFIRDKFLYYETLFTFDTTSIEFVDTI